VIFKNLGLGALNSPSEGNYDRDFVLFGLIVGYSSPTTSYSIQLSSNGSGENSTNTAKVVMVTFGDTLKSQFSNVKPILYKYGLKEGNIFCYSSMGWDLIFTVCHV